MSRSKTFRSCAGALLAAAFVGLASLPAQADDAETVTLNFLNADIDAVIRSIGKITGKNFLIDPRVRGTLNITTQQPVPKALTYQILLSALRLQGYTAVESKGVIKILPEVDAKLHAAPLVRKQGPGGDQIVTQVYQIRNESAAQLVSVIRPLVTPNNVVTAYPGNNTLIVTDYAENIERIGQVLAAIDVPQGDIRVIPVKNASAIDLAVTVNKLLTEGSGGGDASQRVVVLADSRTNSLLVRSDNPSKIAAVRQLASNLDQPGAAGNIRVVYLKNAEATKVAQTLRAVISGESASATTTATTSGGAAGSNTTTSAASSTSSGSTGGGIVQADATNNALIITAPEPVYNNLRKVIDQLDRRRAQVFIEALIVEISSDDAAEFGIQWQAGKLPTDGSGTTLLGGTNFSSGGSNLLGVATNLASVSSGLNVLLGSGTVTVGGVKIANLNLLARFLSSKTHSNILSTPTLVTLDNEEAKIVIGQNVPFTTGSYAQNSTGSTTASPFQTYERKDVGLTLKIKPQISEGGTVKLVISQETSSVVASTASAAAGPTTNKRTIDSTVLIDDGAIMALGGLIENSLNDTAEKVPYIGDVPVLGSLFRYDSKLRKKTNLIVFLRPKILRDPADSSAITNDRYDEIMGKLKLPEPSPNVLMPDAGTRPQLPPREEPTLKVTPAIAPAITPAPTVEP